jgi:hypothetical protein
MCVLLTIPDALSSIPYIPTLAEFRAKFKPEKNGEKMGTVPISTGEMGTVPIFSPFFYFSLE